MCSRYTARQSHQVFRHPALKPVALSYCHSVLEESRGINGEKIILLPKVPPRSLSPNGVLEFSAYFLIPPALDN